MRIALDNVVLGKEVKYPFQAIIGNKAYNIIKKIMEEREEIKGSKDNTRNISNNVSKKLKNFVRKALSLFLAFTMIGTSGYYFGRNIKNVDAEQQARNKQDKIEYKISANARVNNLSLNPNENVISVDNNIEHYLRINNNLLEIELRNIKGGENKEDNLEKKIDYSIKSFVDSNNKKVCVVNQTINNGLEMIIFNKKDYQKQGKEQKEQKVKLYINGEIQGLSVGKKNIYIITKQGDQGFINVFDENNNYKWNIGFYLGNKNVKNVVVEENKKGGIDKIILSFDNNQVRFLSYNYQAKKYEWSKIYDFKNKLSKGEVINAVKEFHSYLVLGTNYGSFFFVKKDDPNKMYKIIINNQEKLDDNIINFKIIDLGTIKKKTKEDYKRKYFIKAMSESERIYTMKGSV